MTAPTTEAGVDRHEPASASHRRVTLACSVLGAVLVALDGTVLTIAQPTLRRDLDASLTEVQWTSTGYLIAVAGLLVFAGRLGDRFGHRRVFAWGVLGFGAASAGIGFAPGVGWVIGLRVVQGVFGALLQPATLGMLRAAFPPDRLAMPIALRTSAIGVAVAAGPLVGGVLVDRLGWRAVFFLNVVPALVMGLLALAARAPRARGTTRAERSRLDLPGAALLAVALAALVHTLVGVPEHGWTAAGVLGLSVAVGATALLVRHERRTPDPLLPSTVLGSAPVRAALGVLVAASAAMLGALFVCSFVLQDALGMDPLRTSLVALPGGVTMVLGAPLSAVLLRRWGARPTALAGTALLTAGVLTLSRLGPGSSAVLIGGGFLLLGAGFGALMVTATAVVVRHAPPQEAGVAGGLQQTAMNVGPTLGVAAATTLMPLGTGPALLLLAAVAALGAPLALRMPRPARPARDGTRSVRNDEDKKREGDEHDREP
ncbi:MFS transporter [Streptomyces caniscabiei]|uniref:MFS transporter n=1 Tax=Streptomyces caniscabiei TaxID=2746961 RepID=A0A927QIQ9_9ACTN|nr:MFS transporter [Streptomyces caniscabiei]MBD9722129.1 MFS transporter [Streptomyces caniscabiei]MDX3509324.1 MFS transporter [Streptomyces caniscabiei]MDX3716923.1 MFS transporter [Streptomyces caniscabiei]MDX3728309.1 MFS transporter [Streptomyces caniscabiei]WEO22793.1 MFS transporter [Streptomyces caniscabiei]